MSREPNMSFSWVFLYGVMPLKPGMRVVMIESILLTASANLVQKLLFKWISEGKSAVRVSTVDRQIAEAASAEAARLRLRVDDLENATKRALQEIVTSSPRLSYVRSGFHSNLRLEFDPKDSNSSNSLLLALKQRVDEITAQGEGAAASRPGGLPPGATLAAPNAVESDSAVEANPDGGRAGARESRKLLDELKSRVDQIETDRK